MVSFLSGPSGQIFALVCISVGAGAVMMTAFQFFLRGNSTWMMYAGLTVLMGLAISLNAVRLRKTIA